jgi:hypothetical protein
MLSVNLACASTVGYAGEGLAPIDVCYTMVGIAMVENGAIESISKDGDTFKVKLNKEKWSELKGETKDALKSCLSEFNSLQGEADAEEDEANAEQEEGEES